MGIVLSFPASTRLPHCLECFHNSIFSELGHMLLFLLLQEEFPDCFILIPLSFRHYVLLALNGIFCLLDLTLPFEFHLPFQPQACYYLPVSFPCFLQKSLFRSGI